MENEASVISESSTDDDSISEDEKDNNVTLSRDKRSNVWCGTDTEQDPYHDTIPTAMTEPPHSSSNSPKIPIGIDLRTRMGLPLLENKIQLQSRTGYLLTVPPEEIVKGTRDENDIYSRFVLESTEFPDRWKIKGLTTDIYLAMNDKGMLYAERNHMEEGTVFIEKFDGSRKFGFSYLSAKYPGWYIGIKRSGKIKRGKKTAYGQKATQFLKKELQF